LDLVLKEDEKDRSTNKMILKTEQYCPISLISNYLTSFKDTPFDEDTKKQTMMFKVEILNKDWHPALLSLDNLALNGAYLISTNKQMSTRSETLILSQTVTKLDKRRIYLRSPVQIINTMKFTVEISYPISAGNKQTDYDNSIASSNWAHYTLKPGQKWCIPVDSVCQTQSNYIKVSPIINKIDVKFEKQVVNWSSSASHKLLSFDERIFIQVIIEKDSIDVKLDDQFSKVDYIYNIFLLPTITFYNYLPYPLTYQIYHDKSNEKKCLQPGQSTKLENAKIGSSLILEMENYARTTWHSSHVIEINNPTTIGARKEENNIIEFRSKEAKIVTFVYNCVLENYCLSFSVYAPYWVLNQTKLKLEYRFKGINDEINEIDNETIELPQFLKINSKIFSSQKKAISIKVKCKGEEVAEWSESFLIDAVGNSGTIISKCKDKSTEKYCEIGVDIHLSSTGLTKIIKLTPYYLLVNSTDFVLDVIETASSAANSVNNLTLMPNTVSPFWPKNYIAKQKNSLKFRPKENQDLNSGSTNDASYSAPVW
jgi:hypothetical protein